MIPSIGIMIGAYIVPRSLSFMTPKEERRESLFVQIVAFGVTLLTLFLMYDLLMSGVGDLGLY